MPASATATATSGPRSNVGASTSSTVIDLTNNSSPSSTRKRVRIDANPPNRRAAAAREASRGLTLLDDGSDDDDSSADNLPPLGTRRRLVSPPPAGRQVPPVPPRNRPPPPTRQPQASTSTARQPDLLIDDDDDDDDDDVVIVRGPPAPPPQASRDGVHLPGGAFRPAAPRIDDDSDEDEGPVRRSSRLNAAGGPAPRPPRQDSEQGLAQELAAAAGVPVAQFVALQNNALANANARPPAAARGRGPYDPEPGVFGQLGLQGLLNMQPGYFGGNTAIMNMLGDLRNLAQYYLTPGAGVPGPSNLRGAAAGRRPAKRYTQALSHPFKDGQGFSRHIVDPADIATAAIGSSAKGKRAKSQIPMKAVCASCDGDLFLEVEPGQRPWALKCGHVVCHDCLSSAKARKMSEDPAAASRPFFWKPVGKNSVMSNDPIVISDDENDLDYEDESGASSSAAGGASSSSAARSQDKGKGKSLAHETGIDEHWTDCPVHECDSMGTDLLAAHGSYFGPFELFV